MSPLKSSSRRTLLSKALWLVSPIVVYIVIIAFALLPMMQTYELFAHRINFWGYTFDHPEDHGLAPGKTINLRLTSVDNTSFGAWFLFSEAFYDSLPFPPPSTRNSTSQTMLIPAAIARSPTILYLHGNTGTRAHETRVNVYKGLTSRIGANVLAIDYRGFGDSEGQPTLKGVAMDARAAWDYLISQGAKSKDILIVGHSLGTAIGALLAAELSREGVEPRGFVLMSPFSSLRTLLDDYQLYGVVPLLKPLAFIPTAPQLLTWSLVHRFDTLSLVPEITTSVLIIHAENDLGIPHKHSTTLFNAFSQLSLSTTMTLNKDYHRANQTNPKTSNVPLKQKIPHFGILESFTTGKRKIAMLKTIAGGHNIPRLEGVQEIIGRTFGLISAGSKV
ncbi:hypothetical protein AMATHDRAFT_4648 [Amanita thiersii Skay4041]|uniref:AB hydrolase-1 domain-containing protein n=1 Tax=Amanita thiersii Skay4041 TaxID=703135 RepID=A0A2A9NK60_9AGAR|nr:hypothetical protein AMATHDRAFT_4648 [Amanita thiersii Skay4041]